MKSALQKKRDLIINGASLEQTTAKTRNTIGVQTSVKRNTEYSATQGTFPNTIKATRPNLSRRLTTAVVVPIKS